MAKDPAVLFYTSDFLSGTAFFTDEQRGQYIRLLCEQHQNGHIPENHMVSICFSLGSPVVKKFVKDAEGNYYNERMEKEIEKRRHFLDTRYFNGKKGGRPQKPNNEPSALPNSKPTENLSDNDNGNDTESIIKGGTGGNELNIPFDIFWQMYGKKIDRAKCEKKWSRLTDAEREDCINNLPAYVQATPDVSFRRNPETYLNNKSWENEIIPRNEKHNGNNGATELEIAELMARKHGIDSPDRQN
jgi:uncharacterized protein YdaU (DUF1376 family)